MLVGKSKLHQHKKAKTLYLAIPASISSDSQFPFKPNETVKIICDTNLEQIRIVKENADESPITIVESCHNDYCKHSIDGKCILPKVHLTISYGRSTDYVPVFMCEEEEFR